MRLLLAVALAATLARAFSHHRRRHRTHAPSVAPSEYEKPRTHTALPTPMPAVEYEMPCSKLPAPQNLYQLYRQVHVNTQICEVVKMQGAFLDVITFRNFQCGQDDCVLQCYYDGNCQVALYSPVLKICMKSTGAVLTDDPDASPAFYANQFVAFTLADVPLPYYGGFCANLLKGECQALAFCGWDEGPIGYNQYTMGGASKGWCGRVKC